MHTKYMENTLLFGFAFTFISLITLIFEYS